MGKKKPETKGPPPAVSATMESALSAFERGDVWTARRLARRASSSPASQDELREALEFLERTGFPLKAFVIAAVAATLLLAMVTLAIARG